MAQLKTFKTQIVNSNKIMNLRKQKKQIPAQFRKDMYESYKLNCKIYGTKPEPYKKWLIEVLNTKVG